MMTKKFLTRIPSIKKSPLHKVGWAKKKVRQLVLGLFNAQDIFLKSMFVIGRHGHAQTCAFLGHNFIRKSGMSIRSLKYGWNPQPCGLL